jgi:hypothetical protein
MMIVRSNYRKLLYGVSSSEICFYHENQFSLLITTNQPFSVKDLKITQGDKARFIIKSHVTRSPCVSLFINLGR